MSDNRTGRSARTSGGDMQGAAPKPRKGGPPPLAWLIIGLLVVLGLIAFLTVDRGREAVGEGPTAPMDLPEAAAAVQPAPLPDVAPTTGPSGGPAAPATPTN